MPMLVEHAIMGDTADSRFDSTGAPGSWVLSHRYIEVAPSLLARSRTARALVPSRRERLAAQARLTCVRDTSYSRRPGDAIISVLEVPRARSLCLSLHRGTVPRDGPVFAHIWVRAFVKVAGRRGAR